MNKLGVIRRTAGLTQDDLASKAGIPRQYVSQLETGRRVPADGELLALARALRFKGDPEDLLEKVEVVS